MLIRIRRLAGSVVGAAFILLLAISLLGTGNSVNPMAFFRGSPIVIEVGNELQRWNTLDAHNTAANALGISSDRYRDLGYGPLITAMAIEDSWDSSKLSISPSTAAGFQTAVQQQVFVTPDVLSDVLARVTPLYSLVSALSIASEDSTTLLPKFLQDLPAEQVVQRYNFELITINADASNVQEPDPATLQNYINDYEAIFRRPATWGIEAIIVDIPALTAQIEVTADQVRQFYDSNPAAFSVAESWDLPTVTFTTELEANLFQAQVDAGTLVPDAIQASNATVTNTGLRKASRLSNNELEFVSVNQPGYLSEINDNDDGTFSYTYFANYQPGLKRTLLEAQDDAEALLKAELAGSQLVETTQALQRQARQEGITLAELATSSGFELKTYGGLQNVTTAPAPLNVQVLFDRLNGVQETRATPSRVTLVPGQAEMLYTITEFEPERPQTFEEAEGLASQLWILEQGVKLTLDRANALKTEWQAGEDIYAKLTEESDPLVSLASVDGLSRLLLNEADGTSDLLAGFIGQLHGAAKARIIGAPRTQFDATLIGENPDLASPFTMGDGEIVVISLPLSAAILRAEKVNDISEQTPREALVKSLVDSTPSDLFIQALINAYLNDVATDRPATVDADAINAQNLQRQQQLAAAGG